MNWKKLGKIFDPTEHKLLNNCFEFAQSPQVLIYDDYVRIYFSTREKENNGKYLSHIAFADYDNDFKTIKGISDKTVIPLGNLGCFDEHGIFPMNVLRVADKVFGYTSGINRRISVSVDSSIGLAISEDDGLTFTKIGDGPVLTSSLYEPFLICDPFVSTIEGMFHMWYSYGTRWIRNSKDEPPDRVYKIGHAISADGITWKKDGQQIISDKIDYNECQALPTVIHFNNRYHIYFCYRHAFDFRKDRSKGYRIGYAYSDDLKNWKRDDGLVGIDVSENGWDSDMLCYPHVFKLNDKIYMLYNGNEFGKYGFGLAILEY